MITWFNLKYLVFLMDEPRDITIGIEAKDGITSSSNRMITWFTMKHLVPLFDESRDITIGIS